MKNSTNLVSIALAAGAAGVAMFAFANSAFVTALPGDVILGVGSAIAMIAFAASDYARRYEPLPLPTRVLRPALPVTPHGASAGPRKDRAAA